jgi:hypothetical protein
MIDFSEEDLRITEAVPSFIDFGFVQRPSTGAKILRVDRASSRFQLALSVGFGGVASISTVIAPGTDTRPKFAQSQINILRILIRKELSSGGRTR